MATQTETPQGNSPLHLAKGWTCTGGQSGSPLIGANGIRLGPDGLLYVAQCIGSQISTVDVASGAVATLVPPGGDMRFPDDLAFDSRGALYATEVMTGRVSARMPDQSLLVLSDQLASPNGIAIHQDRIFVDEFRPGGRLMELYTDGRPPRILCDSLPMPNALSVGPDGYIYFPTVLQDEVWRVPVAGGTAERFATGLSKALAVKFDAAGDLFVAASASGEIFRIELSTQTRTRVAGTAPGIDNFDFGTGGELIVSHFTDGAVSVLGGNYAPRTLVPGRLLGPWGLAPLQGGGIMVADGLSLVRLHPDGRTDRVSVFLGDRFYPGFLRGIAIGADNQLTVGTSQGDVCTYQPGQAMQTLGKGLGLITGMASLPGGAVAVCDRRGGRLLQVTPQGVTVLATGLGAPSGLAPTPDGGFFVADSAGGRILHVSGSDSLVVARGLIEPQGLAWRAGQLLAVDAGTQALLSIHPSDGTMRTLATGLELAAEARFRTLDAAAGTGGGGSSPFADLAVTADGTVYVGCRSILQLRSGVEKPWSARPQLEHRRWI